MPYISKSFISERLLPAVEIEKVIGSYVKLTRHGNNYTCCCPFHHEKTPSFSVTPSKNMFYCFGCHAGGNAIDFLMKFKNLGFVDAVEELAAFAGLQVEYEAGSAPSEVSDRFKSMYELMDRAAATFSRMLFDEQGREGLAYFMQKRGLSKETIIKSRLGFAPNDWHFVEEKICRNEDEVRMLTDLGLIVSNGNKRFSMYRNRVMIPIFDRKGRVISFGGRTMGDDKPKYMNTKETPIYKKRNELFGLYEALRENNNRPQRLVVVEGYMDVISVREAGFSCAVASLGTATTQEQFKLMFRYSKKIVCCYDGDQAGRDAAWHALETITPVLEDDTEVRFAFLPKEDDPDSLVRKQGLGAFLRCLDEAKSYPEFLESHIKSLFDVTDPNARAHYFAQMVKYIRSITQKALQEVCISVFAEKSGLSSERVWNMVEEAEQNATTSDFAPSFSVTNSQIKSSASKDGILTTPMRKLIAFALQYPSVIAQIYVPFKLHEFLQLCKDLNVKGALQAQNLISSIGEVNAMKKVGERQEKTEKISTAVLLARVDDPAQKSYFEKLALADLGSECADRPGCLNRRIVFLATLLPQVLVAPLLERTRQLQNIVDMSADNHALKELTLLSRNIEKRGMKYW